MVETRLVIAQWKQVGLDGGPLVSQRYRSGKHHLTIRDWNSSDGPRKYYSLGEITHGRWNDMVYRIHPSAGDDGMVEVWLNGTRVVLHKGPTASMAGEKKIYNKIGLYRDRIKEPMTIYFDNYTLGHSFPDVDPSRLDRP